MCFWLFFFSSRRRHTRYIGDWSSDVCSSDLFRGAASVASGTVQDGGPSDGILPAAVAAAKGAAGRGGSDGNEHAAAVWRDSERHRSSGEDACGKMERDVSTGQRGIFSSAQDSIRGWQGFHGSGSEWSAQAGGSEPDVCEKIFGK